jgi:hypothetical protein
MAYLFIDTVWSPSTNVVPHGVTQQGEVSATVVTPTGLYSSLSFPLSHSLYNNVTLLGFNGLSFY